MLADKLYTFPTITRARARVCVYVWELAGLRGKRRNSRRRRHFGCRKNSVVEAVGDDILAQVIAFEVYERKLGSFG